MDMARTRDQHHQNPNELCLIKVAKEDVDERRDISDLISLVGLQKECYQVAEGAKMGN